MKKKIFVFLTGILLLGLTPTKGNAYPDNPFDTDTYRQNDNPFDRDTYRQNDNPFDRETYRQNDNPFDRETYRQGPYDYGY